LSRGFLEGLGTGNHVTSDIERSERFETLCVAPPRGQAQPTRVGWVVLSALLAVVLPLVVHVAQQNGAPIVDEAWVTSQVEAANRLYAPHDVAYQLQQVVPLSQPAIAELHSRDDRDSLGAANVAGAVNVYIVAYLADVDASGERRGVHWRVRRGRGRHLVIVSRAGAGTTLAHELGHFFGLPHSTYAVSIMNKTPRDEPPMDQRTFADEEITAMRPALRRIVRDKVLIDQKP